MPGDVCDVCGTKMPMVRKPANWRQALWGGWSCPNCRTEFDRWGRNLGLTSSRRETWTLSNTNRAGSPGQLTLSDSKLRMLRPDLYSLGQRVRESVGLAFPERTYLREQLANGDSRAAVVLSTDPFLVAAFSDDLDCVAVLNFPIELIEEYRLQVGTKLLTVNTYRSEPEVDADLILGPNAVPGWSGFNPLIADFVSDDTERLKEAQERDCQGRVGALLSTRKSVRQGPPRHCARWPPRACRSASGASAMNGNDLVRTRGI